MYDIIYMVSKMEKKKTKKEIVRMLLKQGSNIENEDELIEMLIDEPIAVDVEKEDKKALKFGDRLADAITEVAGSWGFIIGFLLFLGIWILINLLGIISLDPFPFILLNLLLSCLAAIQAPIIMMSQNRQSKKESLRNQNDYRTDLKSEIILEELHDQMGEILKNQRKILKQLENEDSD